MKASTTRQQVLVLHLASPALDSEVVSWGLYDGTGRAAHMAGDQDQPPYPTGLAALRDGWRVLQIPQLIPPGAGLEHTTSHLRYGFLFEKLEEVQ